jgi:hypothetical protein
MTTFKMTPDGPVPFAPGEEAEWEALAVAEVKRLNATKYQEQRMYEYPALVDQLDLMYHGGYDAWKAAIKAVKDKYPKPE